MTKNAKKKKKTKNILYACGIAAWVYVALQLAILIVTLLVKVREANWGQETNLSAATYQTILQALAYALALAITIFVPWKISSKKCPWLKTNRDEMGLRGWPTWTDIALSIVGYISSSLIGAVLLIAGAALFPGIAWQAEQEVGFSGISSLNDKLMAFIALVIVAPVCEELIFRGWMYGKLRARISALPAIILVSLLFAAVHGQVNVGVVVFCMSVANCLIRELTGTIYSGTLVHIIRNAIAFYFLFVQMM